MLGLAARALVRSAPGAAPRAATKAARLAERALGAQLAAALFSAAAREGPLGVTQPAAAERAPKINKDGRAHGVGYRKTSVAQVWISPGKGNFMVNGRRMMDFWPRDELQNQALLPLAATENLMAFDVDCKVKGGGTVGQAGAVRLGLSRALDSYNPAWKPALRANGLMTRDTRIVERKKAGRKKARKSKQWVKR